MQLCSADWVGVALPTVIYVGVVDRGQFDKIAAPATEHEPQPGGERCVSKSVEDPALGVRVIFQHWIAP